MTKLTVKIYNPCWNSIDVAADWGIVAESADLKTVLQQPYKIAALPVMWDQADNFVNSSVDVTDIPVNEFDLVVLSDIESITPGEIYNWIDSLRPRSYVAALGSICNSQPVNRDLMVYRPWWMYNLMRLNEFLPTSAIDKPYMFEALLGARRPHRDFVMLGMQKHEKLLADSIVNYRDIFTGAQVNQDSHTVAERFPELQLAWPYLSPNLDPNWEVSREIKKNISPFIPYEIYQRTWYTTVCETLYTANKFFLTEKTSKPLFAKRLFVMFAPKAHLSNLQALGFETFGDVIDESYDYENIDVQRYQMAFDQMLSLSQQNPKKVLEKVSARLEHNHNRMHELRRETQAEMQRLLVERIPEEYIISNC
jgi:hypothetical protein